MNTASRIGIIGSGAMGGFYGLMLARAGFDAHILLRSEFAAVATQGLQINSAVHGTLQLDEVQGLSIGCRYAAAVKAGCAMPRTEMLYQSLTLS